MKMDVTHKNIFPWISLNFIDYLASSLIFSISFSILPFSLISLIQ